MEVASAPSTEELPLQEAWAPRGQQAGRRQAQARQDVFPGTWGEWAVARVLETVLQVPSPAEAVSLTPHPRCARKEKAHVRKQKTKQGCAQTP